MKFWNKVAKFYCDNFKVDLFYLHNAYILEDGCFSSLNKANSHMLNFNH